LQLNYYLDERLYAWDNPALRRLAGLYSSRTGSVYNFTSDLTQFKGSSPTKLIILADPTDASRPDPRHRDELHDFWKANWGEEVNIICTDPEYLEFMHREANKGAALAHIAAHFGVAREQVIAIGDGRNDTAMVAWAGLGVAVANAHEEVKSAAKYVTEKDNNQAAVAEVIAHFLKI
jgi:hydroxymethylpyrimidine pyrophosphatase-like HAD family hydrolase